MANPIMIRIGNCINRCSGTNHQTSRCLGAPVLKEMPDRYPRTKSRSISRVHQDFCRSLNKRDLSFKNIDHLIFCAVPMLQGRTSARLQNFNKRTKLGQPSCLTDPERLIGVAPTLHRTFFCNQAIRREKRHVDITILTLQSRSRAISVSSSVQEY